MNQELSKETKPGNIDKTTDSEKSLSPRGSFATPSIFNPFLNSPFFSFRYSYQEMSSSEGKTHVRGHQVRYEDGKLSSERFEGTGGADLYLQTMQTVQQMALDSTNLFFKSFTAMLPRTHGRNDKDKE